MNLRDLEYFVAVADLGHFSLAAERCHVSQPTLSGQLKKLEEELGQGLLERDTRSVRLTAFGREALGLARSIGEQVRTLERRAKEVADPFLGPLTLGAFPTLAPWLLPRLSAVLQERYAKAEFFLVEEKTPVLISQLSSGDLDAALLALPHEGASGEKSDLECLPLFAEDFLLAVPSSHQWAERSAVSSAELAGVELILLADGHCLRDQSLDLCRRYGAHEKGHFRATSLETLRQMVRMGSGATLIPRLAIPLEAESGIRYVRLLGPDMKREIGLVFRSSHPRRVLFQHVAETIRGLCENLLPLNPLSVKP